MSLATTSGSDELLLAISLSPMADRHLTVIVSRPISCMMAQSAQSWLDLIRMCRMHNLAHVELNAIDLAWDTVARFSALGLDEVRVCLRQWLQC